jgi:outer membrane receptor protein involved in Fe transport
MACIKICGTAFLAFAVVIGLTSDAAAQDTGLIEGSVVDESGAVVPGATVVLRNLETGVERTVVTESEGRYRFVALQPGTYTVKVQMPGFASEERRDIVLTIGLQLRHDFRLKLESVAENVSVVAEAPVVNITSSEVSGVVTQQQIESLPVNTRQYLNLALLMPGTSQDAVRVFYNNVNVGAGGTFYSNGFVADGVTNTWAEQGEPRQNFPQDSIREFKVNTAQSKAEFGLATGGVVTVVSKSGTNAFNGNVFEYFRHKSLNAKNHFEQSKPDFERHQFGASLGGPIRRDRTHFFAAIERTQTDEFFTVNTGRPAFYAAVEGTFPQPRTVTLGSVRVDHSITQSQMLFARYAHEDERSVCAGSTCGGRNAANAGYDMEIPRRSVVAAHTWILSDRLLSDFRFQFAYAAYQIAPVGKEIFKEVGEYPPGRIGPDRVQRRFTFPSLVWGGNYEALGPEKRWQFKQAFSYHAPNWGGSHDWKFGVDYSYIWFADDSQVNLNGTYQFGTDQFFDPNDPTSIANLQNPILFTMTFPPNYVPLPTHHYAWFVQDDWKPFANLTVNLGLRYDRQIGSFNEDINLDRFPIAIPLIRPDERGDANNFGPRAGFAYDLKGNGATVLRGGYGMYYDNIRTLQNQYEWLNMQRFDVRISNPPYPDPFLGRDPSQFITTAPPNITVLSNDFVNPYSHQSNVGFSQQLAQDLAVHIDGVYTRVRADRKTRNVNLPDPVTGQRPFPEFNRIDLEESTSTSNYRGVYLRLDKRFSDNYQFLVSYSLVDSKDNAPAGRFTDETDFSLDYGPANAERRHSLVASGGVTLPYGVQFGAVWTLRTSLPFSATAGRDLNGNGFVSDYVPGTTRNQGHRDLDLSLVNAWRTQFNVAPVSEDDIDSTRFSSLDLRASKSIPIRGTQRVEVLAQVFNVFNTVNLSSLQTNALAATFGLAARAAAGTQAELAVRILW